MWISRISRMKKKKKLGCLMTKRTGFSSREDEGNNFLVDAITVRKEHFEMLEKTSNFRCTFGYML